MHLRRQKNRALTVALVGYTNAGKSTLMNALTDAGVLVADQLFATLDPTRPAAGAALRPSSDAGGYGGTGAAAAP